MKKYFYIGVLVSGVIATCGVAQANEYTSNTQTYYAPQAVQAYNVAYNVQRRAVPQKRIVRVMKVEEPRARFIQGTYGLSQAQRGQTQHAKGRRIVSKPVKPIPNLYSQNGSTSTPILFDQAALGSR